MFKRWNVLSSRPYFLHMRLRMGAVAEMSIKLENYKNKDAVWQVMLEKQFTCNTVVQFIN